MTEPKSPSSSNPSDRKPRGCLGALVRLSWLAVGNGALFVLTLVISKSGRLSALDALYWVVVAGMVALRYIDITRLGGLTMDCGPATLRDWRRYVVSLLGTAAVLWVSAHTFLIPLMR
jgi:hypothetical protein